MLTILIFLVFHLVFFSFVVEFSLLENMAKTSITFKLYKTTQFQISIIQSEKVVLNFLRFSVNKISFIFGFEHLGKFFNAT